MTRREYGVPAVSMWAVASLAACSGLAPGATAPVSGSGAGIRSVTAQPSATAHPASSAAAATFRAAAGACTYANLRVSVDKPAPPTASGADQINEGDVVVQDVGSGPCVLQGYPGVSFVAGADGHQVGDAAARAGSPGPAVTLAPGGRAHAELSLREAGDTCRPSDTTPVRGYRIYLPGHRAAVFVPQPGLACRRADQGQLRVRAFRAGPGGSGATA